MYKSISEQQKAEVINNMTKNLVALRTMLHLTQAQLAEMMGITRQSLVLYETGKRSMTWNTYLSLLFIVTQRQETNNLLSIMGIYPDELKEIYSI